MDIITQTNTLKFAARLVDRSASVIPPLKLLTDKPLCPKNREELQPFPRVRPDERGRRSGIYRRLHFRAESRKEP